MEKIKCTCYGRGEKIIAEQDEYGNIYVLCRGCKQKVKIEIKQQSVHKSHLNNKQCRVEPKPQ